MGRDRLPAWAFRPVFRLSYAIPIKGLTPGMAGTFSLMFPGPGQTIEVFSFFCSGVRFGSPKGEKRRGVLAKVDFVVPESAPSGKRTNFGNGQTIWTAKAAKETVYR